VPFLWFTVYIGHVITLQNALRQRRLNQVTSSNGATINGKKSNNTLSHLDTLQEYDSRADRQTEFPYRTLQ